MRRKLIVFAALAAAAMIVAIPGAFAKAQLDPGVSARTVTIGTTMPLSGSASLYAPIAKGMQVYFSYINARRARDGRRGVYGRQIVLKVLDDQYNPALTVQQTRRLVEQDRVFAVLGGLGTEQQLAVRQYMNQRRVPQLYVSTGATNWGRDYRRFRWTLGWQPDYESEGLAYGRYVRANLPNSRVAVLMQNDDYGNDYLRGFQRGLGDTAQQRIVARETYEPGAPTVTSQVARLRASGADTFLILAIPTPTIQALVTAYRLGWRPRLIVNSVSATDQFLSIAQNSAGSPEAVNGIITTAYLKDPASPSYARDATVRLYKRLMAKYGPGLNVNNGLYFYGMAKAHDFVQVLYRSGRTPTRARLIAAAANLKYKSPWLLPGSTISTTPRSAFPISYVKLTRFNNGAFTEFGRLIKTR